MKLSGRPILRHPRRLEKLLAISRPSLTRVAAGTSSAQRQFPISFSGAIWRALICLVWVGGLAVPCFARPLEIRWSRDPFNGVLILSWDSSAKATYQLLQKRSLTDLRWDVVSDCSFQEPTGSFHLDISKESAAFYSVALAPESRQAAVEAASGAMHFLQRIHEPFDGGGSGLPRAEASQTELSSGSFSSGFFVPAQLGICLTAAIASHAYRSRNAGFTAGYSTSELLAYLGASANAISNILQFHAFRSSTGQGRALYQVHLTRSGSAPRASEFERTVSLLDNAILIAGMQAARNYLQGLSPDLVQQYADLTSQIDFRLWRDADGNLHLGGPDDPRAGPVIDRIVSESRLAAVVARWAGALSAADFQNLLRQAILNSKPVLTTEGVYVHNMPYFGTALEAWAVSPFLRGEIGTALGQSSLIPLLDAQLETARSIGLPVAGSTGISDGFGHFLLFALSPCEGQTTLLNTPVICPPAVGMAAGALANDTALSNLVQCVNLARQSSEFDEVFGFANYIDLASTQLVNSSNPVRGTLEVSQMAVALLDYLLGGGFIGSLLAADSGWSEALDEYRGALDSATYTEAERVILSTSGHQIARQHASGLAVWHLDQSQSVRYRLFFSQSGRYTFSARYSNDDTGTLDTVAVAVDGVAKTSFRTVKTGSGGNGWDIFTDSQAREIGSLAPGFHEVQVSLPASDGYGVDLDVITFTWVN